MGADYPDIIADTGTANSPSSITVRGAGGATTAVTQEDPDGSAAVVTISANADTGLLSVTRILTSADILQLNSVPFELVAGITGKVLWVVGAFFAYHFVTTPYTIDDLLLINPASWIVVATNAGTGAGFLARTSDGIAAMVQYGTGVGYDGGVSTSSYSGLPLTLKSGSFDPTDGDGTLDVTVLYRIMDA